MKKLLSVFFAFILCCSLSLAIAGPAAAADGDFDSCSGGAGGTQVKCPTGGTWVVDPEVTFTGKNAARAKDLLNWTLRDYRWTFSKEGDKNPLEASWIMVRNIIYSVFILFVMATAFILIATRGKSLSAMRFLPRFFAIVLLVTFSFSLISLLYQTTDLVQGFFLQSPRGEKEKKPCPPACISQEDLFFIDWDYEKFVGYRRVGDDYAESAFINLLLVKLTAFTYFAMVGMLFVRKIILWFFIILSPVFPLLLLYYPVRNTGKIWIGEFFRWLLYAPLFAIFLKGLVILWRNYIPLNFSLPTGDAGTIVYPTATSILVGGPMTKLGLENSANNVNTFALYVVALLMLWMVILLPWVLLQIFLEYSMNYNYAESPAVKGFMGWANRMRNPQPPAPSKPPPPPPRKTTIDIPPIKKPIIPPMPPGGAGLARTIPTESTAVYRQPSLVIKPMPENVKTLRMTNLSVPSLRDVARFETAMVADKTSQIHEISRTQETLTNLANPASITNTTDRSRLTQIREQLVRESQAGNQMASTILNASNSVNLLNTTKNFFNNQVTTQNISQVTNQIRETLQKMVHPETVPNVTRRKNYETMKQSLETASQQGNQFATETLSSIDRVVKAETPEAQQQEVQKLRNQLVEEKQKGNELAKQVVTFIGQQAAPVSLPTQNTVQTVSLEDYEAVRKMWEKNYQTMDVPQSLDKGQVSRTQWIQDDITQISRTVNLLSSSDPELVDQGLQEVSTILPFLMMGGFTLPEITAYLKAKQQAATDSLEVLKSKEEEEESLVEATGHTTAAKVQTMSMQAETPSGAPNESVTATPGNAQPVSTEGTLNDDDDVGSALTDLSAQKAPDSQAATAEQTGAENRPEASESTDMLPTDTQAGEGKPPLKELGEEKELKDLADQPEGPKDLEELDKN